MQASTHPAEHNAGTPLVGGRVVAPRSRSHVSRITALAALGVAVISLTGCAGLRDSLLTPEVSTEEIPAQTNLIEIAEQIAADGTVTPAHTVAEITPAQTLTVTNWVKRPEIFGTAEIVGGTIPGWGPLAAGLFGAAGTLLAAWSNRKRKQGDAVVMGTVQGIEEFRKALRTTDKGRAIDEKLVEALEKSQRDYGAIEAVQKLLELHTGYTRAQIDLRELIG